MRGSINIQHLVLVALFSILQFERASGGRILADMLDGLNAFNFYTAVDIFKNLMHNAKLVEEIEKSIGKSPSEWKPEHFNNHMGFFKLIINSIKGDEDFMARLKEKKAAGIVSTDMHEYLPQLNKDSFLTGIIELEQTDLVKENGDTLLEFLGVENWKNQFEHRNSVNSKQLMDLLRTVGSTIDLTVVKQGNNKEAVESVLTALHKKNQEAREKGNRLWTILGGQTWANDFKTANELDEGKLSQLLGAVGSATDFTDTRKFNSEKAVKDLKKLLEKKEGPTDFMLERIFDIGIPKEFLQIKDT